MTARRVLIGLIVIWAFCFVGGFAHFHLSSPTGDGFTRGANRVMIFLLWQFGAIAPAIAALITAMRFGDVLPLHLCRLAYGPILITGLLAMTIGLLIVWVIFTS